MQNCNLVQLQIINKCSDESQLKKILHGIIDGMCDHGHLNYKDYSEIWSLDEWFSLLEAWSQFYAILAKTTFNQEEVEHFLSTLKPWVVEYVVACWKIREDDLVNQQLHLTDLVSRRVLVDFDWKLKLALSSDTLYNIHKPFLTLDLDIIENANPKNISVELDQNELTNLIETLEAAQKSMLQLSV